MAKFSFEVKLKAVQMYLSGIGSTTVARRLGIKKSDLVMMWVARYRKFGIQGLEIRQSKYDYSGDFKLQVLKWKKQHQASFTTTAIHFDISKYWYCCGLAKETRSVWKRSLIYRQRTDKTHDY